VLHAMVRGTYPARLLGGGLAINSMFVASSQAAGPTVAAAILAVAPWPWLFGINIPLGLAAIAIGARSLPWNDLSKEPYDFKSATLSAATFGLAILALDSISHGGNPYVAAAEFRGRGGTRAHACKAPIGAQGPVPALRSVHEPDHPVVASRGAGGIHGAGAGGRDFAVLPDGGWTHAGSNRSRDDALALAIAVTSPLAGALSDRYPPWLVGSDWLSDIDRRACC